MRKRHQEQISTLLRQIKKAQTEELYAECQEVALFLCDYIEDVAGVGTKTVDMLVEYCELLFRIHNGENIKSFLKKHFVSIENNVAAELKPTRLEMAFISYKAAQSDAIDSIYFAAKADPDCDAFWVPVPYNSRNKDGSRGEEIFESVGFYDERFEITDYKEYDIAARRPDAIFTFNTYDETSFMMITPEEYFCRILRHQTDMLIYMPYFVSDDVPGEDLSGEEVEEMFSKRYAYEYGRLNCARPATFHCHKTILPSENIRRHFEYSYDKHAPKIHKKNDGGAKKFFALGSPKLEKIINATREDYPLSDEWKEIIGNKKVILINMSVSSVNAGPAFVKKIVGMATFFTESQDTVMWWRPHPILESSINNVNPQVLERYRETMRLLGDSKRVIFDNTNYYHQALVWADGFFGDSGSLLNSVSLMGIPSIFSWASSNVDIGSPLPKDAPIAEEFLATDIELKAMSEHAFQERNDLTLQHLAHFLVSDKNTPEATQARRKAYIDAYGSLSHNAGQDIYDYIKGEILKNR